MIIEAYELAIIKDVRPDLVREFLTFLKLDANCFESDNLTLAKTIDSAIKQQINAEYAELWREVLELAYKIDSADHEPTTETIKFILDNKDKLLANGGSVKTNSLLLPILATGSLFAITAIGYASVEQTNSKTPILLATAAFAAVAVSLFVLRRKTQKRQKQVVAHRVNIGRFIEILQEAYKLRLVLDM